MLCATIRDLRCVSVPILAYSYQTSLLIGITTFSFLLWWWFYFQCFLSFVIVHLWVIQCEGDLFSTFANDESIVGNASLFFGVECTKVLCCATNFDLCHELLPTLVHSYQTSL